ncbi:MAG: Mfa1 family fimbria major subunit [Rikenellaceae bacterium]|nr:Mfa1 family fimbria major subunit [Rikenellaceae bacterium]
MNFRSTLVAALAVLTLAACSKSGDKDIDLDPDETTPEATGEQTYTTFTISIANANSRAFHGDTAPTTEEGTVSTIDLYIYDVATQTIEDVLNFTPSVLSQTALITTGPKIFAATANMTPVWTKGMTAANFESYIVNIADEVAFNDTLTVDNSFWMASELLSHTVVSATKNEAETPNHHNNITIKLGRSVAKVGVYYDEDIEVTDGNATGATVLGTMSDVEYRIKNQPDQMYLFTTYDASGVWRTPYFDRNNSIWADVHANNYWAQADWSKTGLDGSYNHEEPTYMMENSNMTARYGNATYASIKGVFSPTVWYDANGALVTSGTWNPGDDFWRIGTVDSNGDLVNWAADNKLYSGDPVIQLGANEAAFKYDGGLMYYWIYLDSSLGNTPPTTTADKYSQHRNQYWDIEITKVTSLGWNEEDGGRPENPEPLDPDAYIHVTIQVLNWEGVYMPGEL